MATLNDLLKAANLHTSRANWVKSLRKAYENMDDPVGEIAGKNPADLIKEHGIPQTAFAAAHGLVAIAKTMTQAEEEIPVSQAEKGVLADLGLSTPDLLLLLAGGGDFARWLIDPSKLLGSYRPEEPDHIVTRILLAQFGDEPVIAFIPNTTEVATKEVAAYWKQRRRTGRRREFLTIDGTPARLYPVGVLPHKLFPENPLYPGKILWGEELECEVTGRPYVNIPMEKRQLMRLALGTEISFTSADDAHDVIDRFEERNMKALRLRYPKASMKFDDLDAKNELPPLMVEVGSEMGVSPQTADYREHFSPKPRVQDLWF